MGGMKATSETKPAPNSSRLLLFSDLDGTLLDDAYRWDLAEPALAIIKTLAFPLILSSSKTLDEMITLAATLDTKAPLIAENGALVAIPKAGPFSSFRSGTVRGAPYHIEFTGLDRTRILAVAHQLRQAAEYKFDGFHDWSLDELCTITGLTREQAQQASNRLATEPILWRDTNARWIEFEAALRTLGIGTVKGGRFIHLMGNTDKAMGLNRVRKLYKELEPDVDWHVVSLGDSPNDLEMLSAADTAVVIPNPRHPAGLDPTAPKVLRPSQAGPEGWNVAMRQLLEPFQNHV